MADPFLGEIRAIAFQYAPDGWVFCNGQLLQIAKYQPLFALLSNTFGGDAVDTFAVPDLRGRGIVHSGAGLNLPPVDFSKAIGAPSVALTTAMTPAHTHALKVTDPGHSHASALPSHVHPFSIPCNDGTAGPPTQSSPANAFHSSTAGVDNSLNTVVADVNQVAVAANDGNAPYPNVVGTPLYAASSNNSMGNSTTGPNGTGTSVPVGSSITGLSAGVQQTPAPSQEVPTQSPAVGLYYIIATLGIWPPRC